MSLSKKEAVEYIISKVPEAAVNNNLLVTMYWKLVDGINIPTDVMRQIVVLGTSPETITRSRRKAIEQIRGENNERYKTGTA